MARTDSTAEGPVARNVAPVDFGLFAPPTPLAFAQDGPLKSMVRRGDYPTSRAAALGIEPRLSELQASIMAALAHHGAMTDEQIERLPEFRAHAPSTVRKRRTELLHMGRIYASQEKRLNERGRAMTVWRVLR